jgi:hypothetical protein
MGLPVAYGGAHDGVWPEEKSNLISLAEKQARFRQILQDSCRLRKKWHCHESLTPCGRRFIDKRFFFQPAQRLTRISPVLKYPAWFAVLGT